MIDHAATLRAASPYNGVLTREQFLFYEMRTTAQLKMEGLNDTAIIEQIEQENLFQYPTEKTIKQMVKCCLKRFESLDDDLLVKAIAEQPASVSKQICLYAMIKHYRLVRDFMLTVIGEKYRVLDLSFSKKDINVFFIRLQEQDDLVASWSETTINKIKQVLVKILVENEYLDNFKSEGLNPVLIHSILENAIRNHGDEAILPAFNCFE